MALLFFVDLPLILYFVLSESCHEYSMKFIFVTFPCRRCGCEFYHVRSLRVRFFKKLQDWILKSERIRKRILCFSITQINPRSLGSWCIKGTEESISRVDSSVPLMHHDPSDLGLICVIKKHKIRFRIFSDLRI